MRLDDALAGTDALTHLDAARAAVDGLDRADLLTLCGRRAAMLLRHEPTLAAMSDAERARLAAWPDHPSLDAVERAALEFTEQYLVDVSSVTDAQVASLREHLGDVGLVDFVNGILVLEQRMTLELVLDGLFGDTPPRREGAR